MRILSLLLLAAATAADDRPWTRHTIDNTSRGADGVRLADVNRDGRPDIVTGWEEGGVVRVYHNPGADAVRRPWPAVTVGRVASPEDAVFVDLDGDGALDVVSSTEGSERTVFVHWASRSGDWRTEPIPASRNAMRWMFALPLQVDGRHGIDLFAGAKEQGAKIGWFESPPNPRDLAAWLWHPLRAAGWIMSLIAHDMDGDGDADLLFSDRKGPRSGVSWLENPTWREHPIGDAGREVMFLSTADLDQDGLVDVLSTVKPRWIGFHRRLSRDGKSWQESHIPLPAIAGTAKAVRAADLDLDGRQDLVFTCEQAVGEKTGVMWLAGPHWKPRVLGGPAGVKYDLIELVDLDDDGDLDLITTEETDNLGVVWYENPVRRKPG